MSRCAFKIVKTGLICKKKREDGSLYCCIHSQKMQNNLCLPDDNDIDTEIAETDVINTQIPQQVVEELNFVKKSKRRLDHVVNAEVDNDTEFQLRVAKLESQIQALSIDNTRLHSIVSEQERKIDNEINSKIDSKISNFAKHDLNDESENISHNHSQSQSQSQSQSGRVKNCHCCKQTHYTKAGLDAKTLLLFYKSYKSDANADIFVREKLVLKGIALPKTQKIPYSLFKMVTDEHFNKLSEKDKQVYYVQVLAMYAKKGMQPKI